MSSFKQIKSKSHKVGFIRYTMVLTFEVSLKHFALEIII